MTRVSAGRFLMMLFSQDRFYNILSLIFPFSKKKPVKIILHRLFSYFFRLFSYLFICV